MIGSRPVFRFEKRLILYNVSEAQHEVQSVMTISEVIPVVTSLSHADKLKLMQVILAQIVQEDGELQSKTTRHTLDPLFEIIGIADGEDADVARRHDQYLYGAF